MPDTLEASTRPIAQRNDARRGSARVRQTIGVLILALGLACGLMWLLLNPHIGADGPPDLDRFRLRWSVRATPSGEMALVQVPVAGREHHERPDNETGSVEVFRFPIEVSAFGGDWFAYSNVYRVRPAGPDVTYPQWAGEVRRLRDEALMARDDDWAEVGRRLAGRDEAHWSDSRVSQAHLNRLGLGVGFFVFLLAGLLVAATPSRTVASGATSVPRAKACSETETGQHAGPSA